MSTVPRRVPVDPVLPTLADVVAETELIDRLPVDHLLALRRQVRHLDVDLGAAIERHRAVVTQSRPAQLDRAVRIPEAAGLLSMTEDYLYRHWPTLGGFRDDDGHIKFSLGGIQRHIQKARR